MANEGLQPITEVVQNLIGAHTDGLRAGFEYTEKKYRPALLVLETQYKKAQLDPATRVPTALHMAIVNLLGLLTVER